MCSYCKPIVGSLSPPHAELQCPVRQADYCSLCSSRGHTVHTCKQDRMKSLRVPQTYEQLLHPNVLKEYGLEGCETPLPPSWKALSPPTNAELRIYERSNPKETDKLIRALLSAEGITPGNAKANMDALRKLAQVQGKRLVFLSSE